MEKRIAHRTAHLQILKVLEAEVYCIGIWPNLCFLRHPPWRHRHGNLIFIVVVDEVRSQPHKNRKVTRFQRLIRSGCLCVDKHAQSLVHPHVKVDVSIRSPGISILQPAYLKLQRLLIQLCLVRRGHINLTLKKKAWGNDIINGLAIPILFHIDRRNSKLGVRRIIRLHLLGARKAGIELPPLTTNELEPSKTQGDRLPPSLHENPHESDAPEITDSPHASFEIPNGDLELQPFYFFGFPIGHRCTRHQYI